ncbi:MAG: LamG-like jellyroll fold domain-containing protein [Nannocystales bacterium]
MRHPVQLACLLAATSCVRINPSFEESEIDGESASGATGSPNADTSTSAQPTASAGGSSTTKVSTASSIGTSASTTDGPMNVEFTDDAWDGEFALAEELGELRWTQNSIQLERSSDESVLESRIFDAGSDTDWETLRWTPRAPYRTPLQLPIDGVAAAYPSGNTGLDDLVLLSHLDGGPYVHDAAIVDSTGSHVARWLGAPNNDAAADIRGVFGRGLAHDDDNDNDAYRIEVLDPVEPGLGAFTWTLWYRSESCESMYMVALDSAAVDPTNTGLHFLGCGGDEFICEDNNPSHAIGFIRGAGQLATRVCSTAVIDDGRWHHIALRRSVVGGGQTVQLFVDGELSGQTPNLTAEIADVSVNSSAAAPEEFTLAGGNDGPYSGAGAYDEFALWNRALEPDELANLYERGALEARFQVRACDEPDCSDRDFSGPGGDDIETGYLDPGLQADHTIDLSGLRLHGRYVQYRFLLRRPEFIRSPAIEAVTVSGTQH